MSKRLSLLTYVSVALVLWGLWMGFSNMHAEPSHTASRTPLLSQAKVFPLQGSREPSGAVAIPHLQGFLVVDDEPKATSDKTGLFFYRVKRRTLRQLPMRFAVAQKRRWNDWEGATATDKDVLLLTSHARRKKKRTQICHFPLSALRLQKNHVVLTSRIHCQGGKRQRDRIQAKLNQASRKYGFALPKDWESLDAKEGGLDLEGIVYDPASRLFWLGLRGPLARKQGRDWAILLSMRWQKNKLPTFQVAGLLDFRGRGIRDVTRLPSGEFLFIAGPVGKPGNFDLYRVRLSLRPRKQWLMIRKPSRVTPAKWPAATNFRPEALAIWRDNLFVWSDSGDWDEGHPARVLRLLMRR